MKKLTGLCAAVAASMLLTGCGSVHQIGYPDSTSNKGKKVTASLAHFNILFVAPPDNLDKLMDDLSEQCGNNRVEGITFSDKRRFFYIFGEMITIEVTGRCAE